MIRDVRPEDTQAIVNIYNHYIENTSVTFEEERIDEREMLSRIKSVTERFFWIVYEAEGQVVAYAYIGQLKGRSAYRYSAESSIYLHYDFRGGGIGSLLYRELIQRAGDMGFHSILGAVTMPNDASAALHEKLGFKRVGYMREVGYKFHTWIDVETWQLLLT